MKNTPSILSTLLWCAVACAPASSFSDAPTTAASVIPGRHWQQAASPGDLGWSIEKLAAARQFSKTIDTTAVMIVQNGVVVDQWGETALPLNCHSVRKSLLSALYGSHVESGKIDLSRSMRDLGVNDNEPSLTDAERDATVASLIKARSGIFHPALYETKAMAAARPPRGAHGPDTFWYYNNWDFNAAGTIFEHLTGRSLFEEFEDRIAGPLGFEDFVRERDTSYFMGEDSVHPAYPFQLSTRDLARVGLLFLRSGRWGGEQIIPSQWVRESTRSYSDAGPSGGYGYMWWVAVDGIHFPGVSLPEGSYSARGFRGQYLVVIPAWELVICHRVNSFQSDRAVDKTEFGTLLSKIIAARPTDVAATPSQKNADTTLSKDSGVSFDLLIRGGQIVDGTGRKMYRGDIAVLDGEIAAMGELPDATADRVIDASGWLIAPGFIDLHSHADEGLVSSDPARRSAPNLITQGITTVVVNQDGGGPLDLEAQRKTMRQLGVGLNVIQTLGHGTLRAEVMGEDHQRPADDDEIAAMCKRLNSALAGGAFGMSAGLEYVPGRWSTAKELQALAETIAAVDGVYIVHERSSGRRPMWYLPSRDSAEQPSMIDNLRELILIADKTKVTTVATHIKARGTDFWGSSESMNDLIRTARAEGLPIYADQYAYDTSGSDGRIVLVPEWASDNGAVADNSSIGETVDFAQRLETALADESLAEDLRRDIEYEITRRGGPEGILIVEHTDTDLVGKSLAEFAKQLGIDPVNAAIELQLQGDRFRRGGARLRAYSMSEKDVAAFASTPWTATSSDAGITLPSDGPVHPRFYGAFPRKIRRYAIEQGLISIEQAVRVSTSLPAEILSLDDRGVLRVGAKADLVVFDPERIRDLADAFKPHQYAAGIEYVFVNGHEAVDDQRWIGSLFGEVLTKQPSATASTTEKN